MMAYESPITLMTEKIANDLSNKMEGLIMECVQRVGVSVDKDELVRAMNYDRGQYEKGYRDGLNDAVRHGKWIPFEFGDETWHKCTACGAADQYGTKHISHITGKAHIVYSIRNYCPICGAKMGGEG